MLIVVMLHVVWQIRYNETMKKKILFPSSSKELSIMKLQDDL